MGGGDTRRPRGARPTQLYDVVVIGNDPPGLVAAALLAKRGLRILHVDHGAPHDRHVSGGFLLPVAPSPLPSPRASRSLHALAEELGVLPMLGRAMAPFEGGLQILLPSARIALASTPDARLRELVRAFGPAGRGLSEELERAGALADLAAELLAGAPPLPADAWLERWKASRFAGSARQRLGELPIAAAPLASALASLHRLFSRIEGETASLDFSTATAPWLFEPSRQPEDGLLALLRASIRGHRGESLGETGAPARVTEIALEGGRFAGVRLEGQDAIHRGRIGVVACGLESIDPLLESDRLRRHLGTFADRLPVARRIACWNLVLAAEAIPPGLGDLAAVEGRDGGITLLEREPARRENGQKSDGLVAVTVARIGPSDGGDAKSHVDEAAEEAMPFHERHLRHAARTPADLPIFQAAGGDALASLPIRTPVPRLLVGNRAVLPGLGLEGGLLAGRRLAALAEEAAANVKL